MRLDGRIKSDELDPAVFGKNEALTNDFTPTILKQKQITNS